jgi:Lon protease-like protein
MSPNPTDLPHDGDVLPLFPLPDFVIFPGVVAPLHIFEPRYRQMMAAILDGSGRLCMGVLREGARGRHRGTPEFWGLGCACRLMDYEKLPDGRYNILIEGLAKVRMKEVPSQKLFRLVKLECVETAAEPPVLPERDAQVRALMRRIIAASPDVPPEIASQVEEVELAPLLHLMAYHCPVPIEEKLKLFYTTTYAHLCDRLIKLYETVQF